MHARKPRKGHRTELLRKGDTVFANGPCRFTIKQSGANGGAVRVLIVADESIAVKAVRQRRKVIRGEP